MVSIIAKKIKLLFPAINMSFASNLLNRYTNWLTNSPSTSRFVTTSGLFVLGDFLCQTGIERKTLFTSRLSAGKQYDFQRTGRMFFIGGFIAAPLLWGWLNFALPKAASLGFIKNAGHWPQTAWCLF